MAKQTPKNGFHIEYFDSYSLSPGEKWKEGNYKDGKKIGLWTWWYGNEGVKSREENYKDGLLNGLTINFDEDGRISDKVDYVNGRKNGLETIYKDGYISIIPYINGRVEGKYTEYFQNNQKKSEGNVSGVDKEDYSPFREGKWTTWYETGEKESEIADHSSSGKKNGFLTEWFKNGKKQSVHFCEDGRMITMFVWDEDGTDITAKVYEDADRLMRETDERRQQRGIKTTLHKRNISLEGRNIPLTDDEKELGADFWSDIYGDDFIDDDPF